MQKTVNASNFIKHFTDRIFLPKPIIHVAIIPMLFVRLMLNIGLVVFYEKTKY